MARRPGSRATRNPSPPRGWTATTTTGSPTCGAPPPGAQEALVAAEPDTFFRPPYVGHRGWLGIRLDGDIDWDEVAELLTDAYLVVAPAKLVARLPAAGPG